MGSDGKAFTLFETNDLSVQVVRVGPDGALYAATLPSGKVYKLNADATAKQDETSATVVFDLCQDSSRRKAGGEQTRNKADDDKGEQQEGRESPTTSGI